MYIESDNDPMELPHCAIRIGREIGKGAFGRVYLAQLDKNSLVNLNFKIESHIVAVKQLKRKFGFDLGDFLKDVHEISFFDRQEDQQQINWRNFWVKLPH